LTDPNLSAGGLPSRARVRWLLLAALMCAMTIVGAYIRIPLMNVPVTLQTFFVILSGMVLGPFYGALSQIAYVLLGLAGAPIFAKGGGLGYVLQPTFGYLLGYPLASGIVGRVVHGRNREGEIPRRSTPRLFLAGALGMMGIFVPGVIVLYLNLNLLSASPISWPMALWSGFLIFIPGDIVKITGAIVLYRALQRLPALRQSRARVPV
jgi:biotin transport system substrate-specific component